ncbi:MAG: aspartate/glutamate racemase family protein [Patescibacteria group bacterium]
MTYEKIIGIGGGVGPMAGVILHQKIIENTLTNGTDQDHLEVHHFSRSSDISDRNLFLLEGIGDNPALGLIRTAEIAKHVADYTNKGIVFGIPCNNVHAPSIINPIKEAILQLEPKIKFVDMIGETVSRITTEYPEISRVGLLSTSSTRKIGTYRKTLEPLGYSLIEVEEDIQEQVHDSICNTSWGIKAQFPVTEKARENFERFAKMLKDQGAQAIILGCTEIPLALPQTEIYGIPLIDPMESLALGLIREANPNKVKVPSKQAVTQTVK